LVNSKTRGKAILRMTFEGQRDREHSAHDTHAHGIGN
jgi:hypothetical protein